MRIPLLSLVLFIVTMAHAAPCFASFKVIYTAALIDEQFEERKQEYIYTLNQLIDFGVTPFIVEACRGSSFFDDYGFPVCYSQVNNLHLKNKGVNEARSLKEAFKFFQFDDEDMILKMTGRYYFTNNDFFTLVADTTNFDAVLKVAIPNTTTCFMGCYAMKCKYFKQFLDEVNLERMEREMINFEDELGYFINRNPSLEVLYVERINMTAYIYGQGQRQLTNW